MNGRDDARRRRVRLRAGALMAWLLAACGATTAPPALRPTAPARPGPSAPELTPARARALWSGAQAVFNSRCAVCHGCYDAPCQLKLDSFEGIARGASTQSVYDPARVVAVEPTRLFVDAHSTQGWREKSFHAVVPDAQGADPRASLLLRLLELKRAHPLPAAQALATDFTLELDRKQSCVKQDGFEAFEREHPLWGMPYAMAGLSPAEHAALVDWVLAGTPHPEGPAPGAELTAAVASFERFMNDPAPKSQLMARYLYEHLFLASLYFEDVQPERVFRLVRSRTDSGSQADEIPTRRPFEDPGVARVYYRLVPRSGPALAKTQMPYALGEARLRRWRQLFLEPEYEVGSLPSYAPELSSNPLRAFAAIPVQARYRFLLDDAQFVLSGFIKGPVCRGQVALNVIQERFWVVFVSPDAPWAANSAPLLADVQNALELPAALGSNALPIHWLAYAQKHARYVQQKNAFLQQASHQGRELSLQSIWDGDGHNANAALTVFRHFDSASVVQGLVGGPPKTAWVVDYPQLERLHYLLVAGFDVFGNLSHQLMTRMYMDFLRMEAEANLLALLPPATRGKLVRRWYRGLPPERMRTVWGELLSFPGNAHIRYHSRAPDQELLALLEARLGPVRSHRYDLVRGQDARLSASLQRLARVSGLPASQMPETAFILVSDRPATPGAPDKAGADVQLSVLRDSAHSNVAQLFQEEKRRLPQEDGLTVVRGFVGAYPNALFALPRSELDRFVDAVEALRDAGDYEQLRKRFGVSRTTPAFWAHSDRIHRAYRSEAPLEAGLFDYNRLDRF